MTTCSLSVVNWLGSMARTLAKISLFVVQSNFDITTACVPAEIVKEGEGIDMTKKCMQLNNDWFHFLFINITYLIFKRKVKRLTPVMTEIFALFF